MFRTCQVVSNHLPDRDDMVGILNRKLFELLPKKGIFINTGRGRQVNEPELAEVLARRIDLSALLDVTFPEPPAPESPLYSLPNVFLSPHLAGSVNDECHRMADYMLDECRRYLKNEPLQYEVKMEYLLNLLNLK
jgi:phosphoglycerate dehydrogenase-like enzyme